MTHICIEDHYINGLTRLFIQKGDLGKECVDDDEIHIKFKKNLHPYPYIDKIKYYMELSEWVKLQRNEKLKQLI
jgi:hypothetical protein